MPKGIDFAAVLLCGIAPPANATPVAPARTVSLPPQPLARSLQAVAKTFGIDLLFSEKDVAGRVSQPVSGSVSSQQALDLLLSGSGLTARRIADGSFVITVAPVAQSEQRTAEPDILVIGRRTQNADIRRTENDVRPYQVISREEIATSHIATVEELASKRLPANDVGATLSQQGTTSQGSTASSINLRGLGTADTLILVDGRRVPMVPNGSAGFDQSDVNALPPEAIERVEAITATAGGVYGPGATGGVINLVLRRNYRGIDVAVTSGLTQRGDAPYGRIDLRAGFTPDHGATDVMIDLAESRFGGLDVGDRDYRYRATERVLENYPDYYALGGPPSSRSITVTSSYPLVLKPDFGGTALGSRFTFTPPADHRSTADLIQSLIANAGKVDLRPSDDATGARQTLLSARRTTSIIANVRHRSGRVELFLDFLRLSNKGHARSAYGQFVDLDAASPFNPFKQSVTIYSPDPVQTINYDFRSTVTRATAGAIITLPGSWRGEADYSRGTGGRFYVATGRSFNLAGLLSYFTPRDPLGDYSAYLASYDGLFGDYGSTFEQKSRFHDASLRLAGPIVSLPGGELSATVLAESRSERVSGGTVESFSPLVDSAVEPLKNYAQSTRSIYGELRAPLIDPFSGFQPLRGLEVQLAIRRDQVTTEAVRNALALGGDGTRTVRNSGIVYTAGLKFAPVTSVLFRGSLSSGQQPPTTNDLARFIFHGVGVTFDDPRRPGDIELFDSVLGGSPNPKPQWARSLSAGIVFQPPSVSGLRISVDFTHINKRGENVVSVAGGDDYFIAHEHQYPDRVTRLTLTPTDAAKGYTAGVITQVDQSSLQNGRTILDAIDTLLDYRISAGRSGVIDLHGAATWQPRFRRIVGFGLPSRNYRGVTDGAPALRANAGARWSLGPWSLSVAGQMTGRYRITSAMEFLRDAEERFDVVEQGGSHIPAQATIDLAGEYRFPLRGASSSGSTRTLALRLGIQDLFDTRPATVVNAFGKYNNYLDPRRRRFELTLATGF